MAKYKSYHRVVAFNWRKSSKSVKYFDCYVTKEQIVKYFQNTDERILQYSVESMEPSKAQPLITLGD